MIFQNGTAANFLISYFTQAHNAEYLAIANHSLAENVQISRRYVNGGLASMEDLQALLDINRTMRRLFDQTATAHIESFDSFTVPGGDWNRFYKIRYDD